MLRIAGLCWIAIAIIHMVVALATYFPQWQEIAQAGWFNVVAPDPFAPIFDREDAFWFMMLTPFFLILGQLCLWADRQKLTLPISVSGILLASAITGIFFIPISGFWLVLIPNVMMLYSSKSAKSQC
ncbi:hypothetical protein FNW02_28165 [Komarekiella sp. 'clone 1']|uniref:Uncharacterized protein n=1 Tax=Komarekiella delphini-convector SJRDD-AB1 TaxID=2593771 RepID=A0AA40VTW6_9NOST|nr:hypothetical protein [Komarekiella delphini-convector SJRDD-AB1]